MGEEHRKALLTRVLKVTPWNVAKIVSHIIDRHTSTEIEDYVNGSDAAIHALIDEMKSMMPKAGSLGPDYPPLSGNSQGQSSYTFEGTQAASAGRFGTSQLPVSSIVPDDGMRDFPPPSLNSQAHQPSDTFEGIQAPPSHQIGTSLLPGSSSVPDDGMRDFLALSWSSQAQSTGASVEIQSANAGPIGTSQITDGKSTRLKEHHPSSSVQGCSNVTGYLPSTSRSWPDTCYFFMS